MITASPFHPVTGELLPVYRDAFLVGDLIPASMQAVTKYLQARPIEAKEAIARWHELAANGGEADLLPLPVFESARNNPKKAFSSFRVLRMFGLSLAMLLAAVTTYGIQLLHRQQKVNAGAKEVFNDLDRRMEEKTAGQTFDASKKSPNTPF